MKPAFKQVGLLLVVYFLLVTVGTASQRFNVLFLVSDDMNDWIGCLGGHPDAITPNLDKLAGRSILFEQAHCSAPICNPSRASVMSGLNPSTTGCYDNRQALRMSPVGFDVVTMPRYFSNNGYFSAGTGKITHGKFPDPASWDSFYPDLWSQGLPGADAPRKNMNGIGNESIDWGPLDVGDAETEDGKLTAHTIDMLSGKLPEPFFFACGWKKPHLPWFVPRKYFDMYDPETVTLPLAPDDDLDDLPKQALRYTNSSKYRSVTRAGKEREGVQAYLASISFIDEQVGQVMDALEKSPYANNTIVIFWGDHGWHLGEKRHWSKSTLWEESTRAPLLAMVPGMKPARIDQPVSFLDIYPTLVELAGLPENDRLEGQSLVPLMHNPELEWRRPALTTHGKNNHTLRSQRWRYTHYADGGEELYDHQSDPMEWNNLAGDPEFTAVKERMQQYLPSSNADDVYELDWPKEKDKFWEATLSAAESYHGKAAYPDDWEEKH